MQPTGLQSPQKGNSRASSRSCSPARPARSSSSGAASSGPAFLSLSPRVSSSGARERSSSCSGAAMTMALPGPLSGSFTMQRPASRMQQTTSTASAAAAQETVRVFKTKTECWVAVPPKSSQPPKGIIHFLGGAFAGAAPQVLYSLLIDELARAGFTVIATPYAISFKHLDCADTVRNLFTSTIEELRESPSTAHMAPADAPLFGVGHSMGALLHLLINSVYPGTTDGNVCLSYNNKDVSAAIPMPGFLESMSPAVAALRNSPVPLPLPMMGPDTKDVLRALSAVLPSPIKRDEAGQISEAALALDQIKSVFGEVGDGVTDFTPSPAGSRQIIKSGYCPDKSPIMLVRFQDDSIDESPEMCAILQSKNAPGVSCVTLPGSHTTPCTSDLKWESGAIPTPLDAVINFAKWQGQTDVRRLCTTVTTWLNVRAQQVQRSGRAKAREQTPPDAEAPVTPPPQAPQQPQYTPPQSPARVPALVERPLVSAGAR